VGNSKSSDCDPSLPNHSGELLAAKDEASMLAAQKVAAHARAKEANRALMKDVFGKKK